jgi:hypothetical protein
VVQFGQVVSAKSTRVPQAVHGQVGLAPVATAAGAGANGAGANVAGGTGTGASSAGGGSTEAAGASGAAGAGATVWVCAIAIAGTSGVSTAPIGAKHSEHQDASARTAASQDGQRTDVTESVSAGGPDS